MDSRWRRFVLPSSPAADPAVCHEIEEPPLLHLPQIDFVRVAKTKSRTAFWVIQKLSPPCCSVRSVPRRVARSIFRLIQVVTLCESTPNAVAKEQAE